MKEQKDSITLTTTDKEILSKLSEIGKASMYVLAKEASLPYSSTFNSVKKLESLNLIKEESQIDEEESGRKKIIYVPTNSGLSYLSNLVDSFDIGVKQLSDIESDPLNDNIIGYLLAQKRESSEVDFKATLDTHKDSDFVGIAKDIFAMSNYGGGYLIIGFKETESGSFEPTGLLETFHIDQAQLQEKFNALSNCSISIGYREITAKNGKYAVLYVPPSPTVLKPIKYGKSTNHEGKVKTVFATDEILFRRGTQSITANEEEIKFIERRSKETEYQIGLLNGMPDRVRETLYSNFFETIQMPETIFSADLPQNIRFSHFETGNVTYVRQNNKIYSFSDLNKEPFLRYITKGSLQKWDLKQFSAQPDKRIVVTWLLNQEVRNKAIKLGLRYDGRNKNLFFFPIELGQIEKFEPWEGRFKKSKRLVAKRLPIESLGTSIFVHTAASISFTSIGSDFYLKIVPEIVLTHNGYETIQGVREGIVKTKLIYNQYNVSYFYLVLFWISKLKLGSNINLNDIIVSTEPVTVSLNVGIRSDRPSEEFARRKDELYSIFSIDEDAS